MYPNTKYPFMLCIEKQNSTKFLSPWWQRDKSLKMKANKTFFSISSSNPVGTLPKGLFSKSLSSTFWLNLSSPRSVSHAETSILSLLMATCSFLYTKTSTTVTPTNSYNLYHPHTIHFPLSRSLLSVQVMNALGTKVKGMCNIYTIWENNVMQIKLTMKGTKVKASQLFPWLS